MHRADPVGDPLVARRVHGAVAAGHDEDIGRRDAVEGVIGDQGQGPADGPVLATFLGHQLDLGAGQAPQHLERADKVERRDSVEQHKGDFHVSRSIW